VGLCLNLCRSQSSRTRSDSIGARSAIRCPPWISAVVDRTDDEAVEKWL
jgi:hypothetical protein